MTLTPDLTGGGPIDPGSAPARMAWGRFRANPAAMAGLIVLTLMVFAVLVVPALLPYAPTDIDLRHIREAPSGAHLLGTDDAGRDVLARLLSGGRISLLVGFATAASALALGTFLGVVSGYVGGVIDLFITRLTELFMAVPSVLVVIVLAGVLGPSVPLLIGLIALFSWPTSCRIARSVVLSVRELEYVQAAHAAGTKGWRILVRHLLPNVIPQVAISGALLVAGAILAEAGLSFLGLGVTPPAASWGNMLQEVGSFTKLTGLPWLWLPAGAAMSLTTLSVIFIGDGLRDALDPRGSR